MLTLNLVGRMRRVYTCTVRSNAAEVTAIRHRPGECSVKYTVVIDESDEGFAASVPGLPGCHSQGASEAEVVANIKEAIREYLDVVEELAQSTGKKQIAVEV